ncbi:tetratricopeptide repeat protein, partial [Candidatus Poribacteria bacterium]|nr:tetratricopeptide repeat protein [Candidatus Poribacteria bacterium]
MAILELALTTYGIVGTTTSVIGGIDLALKHFSKITAEDLFKKCLDEAVKEYASSLIGFTKTRNPKTISVDPNKFDSVIASLKDTDIAKLRSLKENERLTKITAHFRDCINLPDHQLVDEDLEQKLRPVFEKTIVNFYGQLPFKQEAFNQIALEFIQRSSVNQTDAQVLLSDLLKKIEHVQLEVQECLTENIQAIKNDTEAIKDDTDTIKTTSQENLDINWKVLDQVAKLTNTVNRHLDISIPDDIETERQSTINMAKDLLETHQPETAFKLLNTQKKRIWADASTSQKFNILTNMAAAQFALNNEQETARLLLEAFQYNPEEEKALSNCALAHLLLEETGKAADYAKQALDRNPANVNARVVLIAISADEETLEEVIAKVPKDLRETPQIAYAISDIAKQRGNIEEARKWRETIVAQEQGDVPDFKAALAAILIEQALANQLTVVTKQFDEAQKKQLRQAIELLTEAWDCVSRTELRDFRVNWIINRSMAHFHLRKMKEAIKDLDTALEIEPLNSDLLKKRAISAFEDGKREDAIEFIEKIQSVSEVPEVPIILANILSASNRFEEAITRLNDFLTTNPSSELQEEANRLLIRIYIDQGCFTEAQQISRNMCESCPTNILYLVDAARISNAAGEHDEALLHLKEAYNYAQDSEEFLEIVELADQLYIHKQFKEAATLYEKLADTEQNSELTQWLLKSYYNAGEIKKALELCRKLREKYEGPLENVSKIEYEIYEKIGDLSNALAVCEAYLRAFPDDTDMQMHLAYVHYRLNNFEEFYRLLERSFDLKNLSLQSHFNLVHLHQIGSKPERALEIMYEARRTYFNKADVHLKYVGLFLQVEKQISELLHPTQVQSGTAVGIDNSGEINWYIIENREDADYKARELDVDHPLSQLSLGKSVNDELYLQQNPVST